MKAKYYAEELIHEQPRGWWCQLTVEAGETKTEAFRCARSWNRDGYRSIRIRHRGKVIARWKHGKRVK